ncbi:MAG TPA: hypothetical protein VN577_04135 [Terriglobales bacterium]|nr:hypothetical protein [Terriglobales bacterium]
MRQTALLTIFLLAVLSVSVAQNPGTSPATGSDSSAQQPDYAPPPEPATTPQQNAPMGQDPNTTAPADQDQNAPVFDQRSASNNTQQSGEYSVPAGTEIKAALDSALSTKTSQIGDQFTATVIEPVRDAGGAVMIPAGAKVRGEVTEAEEGKTLPELRGKGRLNLRFREIELRNGTVLPLLATLTSVNSTENAKTSSKAGDEGEVQSGRSGKEAAKDIGIGAAVGTVAGLIFGSALKGLAIGAIAGGGYVLATKGKDVELPAETGLNLRLDQPIQLSPGDVNNADGSGVQ